MNKVLMAVGLASLVGLSAVVFAAHDTKADVRYADFVGKGDSANIKGSVVMITLPNGDHDVYLRVAGLAPNSGKYANHVHFNTAGTANCEAQNGDQAVALEDIVVDAKGMGLVYTRISKNDLAKFPDVKMYMNLHSNNPKPIGDSVSCGEVLTIKLGAR